MPDLLEIENIASNTPPRTVVLSGMSATVLFSALDAAKRIHDWWSGDDELSPAQIDQLQTILGNANKELMVVQIGEVKATAAGTIPAGCLLCDGGTYERVDYPDLYAALAPAFIVDADTFITPDLRSRFVWGSDSSFPIGSTGGAATHTLDVSEMPTHSHTIPLTATTLALEPGEVTVTTPIPFLTQNTGDTGGGAPHNNMPPYLALRYYIVAV
jgi:microcystin-dependent protein